MEFQRYAMSTLNSDLNYQLVDGVSSSGTPRYYNYSSRSTDARDGNCNSKIDDVTTSNIYNSDCRFGMQYKSQDFWQRNDTNTNNGKVTNPFYDYASLVTSSDTSLCNGYTQRNGKNVPTSNTNNTIIPTTPDVPHGNLTQTTPINSVFITANSHPPFCNMSLMAQVESLKKKDLANSTYWGTRKTQTRKSVKRNLKYLPAVTNKWHTKPEASTSDCMHTIETATHNQNKFDSSTSNLTNNEYSSLQYEPNSLQYRGVIDLNDQASCRDISPESSLGITSEYIGGVCPLQDSTQTTDKTVHIDDNMSQSSHSIFKPSSEINIIKAEKANENKENSQKRIDEQGIPVGPPTRFIDHRDELINTSEDLKRIGNNHFVCCSCVSQTVDRKSKIFMESSVNSTMIPSKNISEDTSTKGGTMSAQSSLKSEDKNGPDNGKVVRDGKTSSSYKGKNRYVKTQKVANNNIELSQIQLEESDKDNAQWMKLIIQVGDNCDQGSHLCLGCQKPVFDRYVIQVKDHGFWHADCLKCSNCQDNLSGQKSCYVKNEQVFCRNDYNILFGLSCVKCSLQFKREQDWMRVAGQHRYHIACFLCKICKRQLGNNEKYHLVNGTDIYCTNHYRDMVNGESSDGQQPPKKAKRNRTSYTEAQIKFLQDRFLRDSNPDGNELEKIATHINLKKRVVQVWFQNNRARLKKSANNTKSGNQENKNPSVNGGVGGNSGIADVMSIDWDNSMEQSSLDEHTYPNSASPSQMRPGSAHFMDPTYNLTPTFSGSLLCLPAGGTSSTPLAQEPASLGDGSGSGTSTCGTPRDQISPHFSDMSNPAYQSNENTGSTTLGGNDSSAKDLSGSGSNDYNIGNNNSSCSKDASSPNIILSALRSSVMRDKFSTSCQRRMETRDQQDQDMRNQMMLFQDQSLRHHPHHHQQSYHIDIPYGAHMGIYSNIYNMYSGYGPLNSLSSDQNAELSDTHQSFLRIRSDQQQNSSHLSTDPTFEPHYNNESHIFRSHIDMGTGFISTRPTFIDINSHHSNSANAGTSGNNSPLSFLGASASNQLLQSQPSSDHCSYLQGHHISSPLACGQSNNYSRSNCGSPTSTSRQNGGSYLHSMSRSGENFFVDGGTA